MRTGPSNPTRTLAAALAVLQVATTIAGLVQQAMWPRFDDPTILLTWMNVFWGATGVAMHALLIGLVLSCDRRIAPAIALFVWLALSPLTHIPVWLPELPRAASFAAWLLHELSWLSVIAAVAFVQARRVVFVLGGLSASFVLLAIGMGLGWAEVDARAVRMALTLFRGLVARADATTGAYAAVIVCSAFLVPVSFALSPRDPLFAVLVGLLGLCVLIGSLVALGLWVFLCFGLARRLDQEEPTEDMYAG